MALSHTGTSRAAIHHPNLLIYENLGFFNPQNQENKCDLGIWVLHSEDSCFFNVATREVLKSAQMGGVR